MLRCLLPLVLVSTFAALAALAEEPLTLHGVAVDAPLPRRVVVLVHGLDEPGTIWRALIPQLVVDGHVVAELHYPNDQAIDRSVVDVAAIFASLRGRGVERVALVAHSMGGLVCRRLLADPATYAGANAHEGLPTVERLIMVATPNHGSQLARLRAVGEAREQLVRLVDGRGAAIGSWLDGRGEAGADLLPDSAFLRALAAEPLPTGVALTVIAGDSSPLPIAAAEPLATWWRANVHDDGGAFASSIAALADGTGDGAVALTSAHLDGVTDELVLHANHLSLLEPLLPGAVPPAIEPIRERLRQSR